MRTTEQADLALAAARLLRSMPKNRRDEAARMFLQGFVDNLARLHPDLSPAELERRKREHEAAINRELRGGDA